MNLCSRFGGSNVPRLLYVLHEYQHLGGTELQTRLLVEHLAGRYEIGVVWIDPKANAIVMQPPVGALVTYPADPVVFPFTPDHQPTTQRSFAQLLKSFQPDMIHFQHLVKWPLGIIDQARESGAKVVVSLYDYYAITPYYTMEGIADPKEIFTQAYAAQLGPDGLKYLEHRRALLEQSFGSIDRCVVLSRYQRRIMSEVFSADFAVIEPGIAPFVPLPKTPSPHLRFGYLGTLVKQKGWPTLVEAFQKVRQKHPAAELRLYGANRSIGQPPAGISVSGVYGSADLPRICSEFDVGIVPSTFPETYCIVLSELWQSQTPSAVSDIGALGDRVIDGVNGRKFPPGDVDNLANVMNWFIETESWRTWRLPTPRTSYDLAADHDALYRSLQNRTG